MRFDWNDYLGLARELANCPRGDDLREAKLRSAISRGYYAAFHHARAYYRNRYDREPPGAGSGREHQLLPRALRDSQRPHERRAGYDLRQLRRQRRYADYLSSPSPNEWHVARSLHLARDIIDILQA